MTARTTLQNVDLMVMTVAKTQRTARTAVTIVFVTLRKLPLTVIVKPVMTITYLMGFVMKSTTIANATMTAMTAVTTWNTAITAETSAYAMQLQPGLIALRQTSNTHTPRNSHSYLTNKQDTGHNTPRTQYLIYCTQYLFYEISVVMCFLFLSDFLSCAIEIIEFH